MNFKVSTPFIIATAFIFMVFLYGLLSNIAIWFILVFGFLFQTLFLVTLRLIIWDAILSSK